MSTKRPPQEATGYVSIINIANGVTILRFPLLVLVIWLMYQPGTVGRMSAVVLLGLLMLMDTVDGAVARWRGETTLLGSALDIATDRAVEFVLWVVFAHLGLVSIVVPLVVMIRGALVDSIRDVGAQRGISAHAMMRTRLGRWLVVSPVMRTGYALVKIAAFLALALTLALQSAGRPWTGVAEFGTWASWLAVVLCLARGIPVVVEAPAFIRSMERGGRG
ncbi:MAG: CDP-alcohol phosphatidyltransferase family protein [Gemmatimonadales bacterium]|nr:CDP-alcohol phosphatidyltransferase family protein [Gemmatimonadales bacterium]